MIGEDDAPLAFALAHEIAHHELGHVAVEASSRWRDWLGESAGLPILAAAMVNRWLFSPRQEHAADREGLARAHRAGFDLTRCITLFDVLARWEDTGRDLGANLPGDWLGGSDLLSRVAARARFRLSHARRPPRRRRWSGCSSRARHSRKRRVEPTSELKSKGRSLVSH